MFLSYLVDLINVEWRYLNCFWMKSNSMTNIVTWQKILITLRWRFRQSTYWIVHWMTAILYWTQSIRYFCVDLCFPGLNDLSRFLYSSCIIVTNFPKNLEITSGCIYLALYVWCVSLLLGRIKWKWSIINCYFCEKLLE